VLQFDGSEYLQSTAAASTWSFLHNGTEFTVIAVAKHGAVAEPDDVGPFVSTIGLSSAQTGYVLFGDDRSAFSIDNRLRSFAGRSAAPGVLDNGTADNALPGGVHNILSDTTDLDNGTPSARSVLRVNGGTGVSSNSNTGTPSAGAPTTTLRIGDANGTTLAGEIAELLILQGTVTTGQREKLEGYLAHKWGLASLLPGGHPYKSSPP